MEDAGSQNTTAACRHLSIGNSIELPMIPFTPNQPETLTVRDVATLQTNSRT